MGLSREDILSADLGTLSRVDRALVRGVMLLGRDRIAGVTGIEHVTRERDPLVLCVNHSTRLEAVLLPALLMLPRNGRHVHFFADWNFKLIPGVGLLYGCAKVIVVPNKDAKPRFLTALRPLLTSKVPPMEQARRLLAEGHSVGIFPEGTVNHDPIRLMRGRLGAARLSLQSGVPIVPAGLSFPDVTPGTPVKEGSLMQISFGPAMRPPADDGQPETIQAWHGEIMSAIAGLAHKLPYAGKGGDHEGVWHHAQQAR